MRDRGFLFIFSLLMTLGGLAFAAWLAVSGQAATVDGLFLLLVSLVFAAAFALYLAFLVRGAMEAAASRGAAEPAKAASPGAKAPAEPVTQA